MWLVCSHSLQRGCNVRMARTLMSPSAVPTARNSIYRQIVRSGHSRTELGLICYLTLESLIMLIVSMPATTLVQRLNALLKVLYRNSLERSRDSMSHARVNFPVPKNGRSMYQKCLKNMILCDCVQYREMLGTKLDDRHCLAVVSCDFSPHTELGCVVDCHFEHGDCGAGEG